jgi:hypothetical protein
MELTFDDLSKGYEEWNATGAFTSALGSFDQQQVNIRGFLYPAQNEKWILASEPDLKSCCVGSETKIMKQIYVVGNIPKETSNFVVALQGQFHINPEKNAEGKVVSLYQLTQALIAPEKASEWPFMTLVILGCCVFAFFLMKKSLSRRDAYIK